MTSQRYTAVESDFLHHASDVLRLWAEALPDMNETSAGLKLEHGYLKNPAGPGKCIALTANTETYLVGVQCLHIRRFSFGGRMLEGAALADYVVTQEHRSLGPALRLLKHSMAIGVNSYDFVYGMPNANSRALCKRVGLKEIGQLQRYGKLLSTGFLFRNRTPPNWIKLLPVRPLADLVLRTVDSTFWMVRGAKLRCRDTRWNDPAIDEVWRSRDPANDLYLCERNTKAVQWRYGPNPSSSGWLLTLLATRAGSPLGFVVWKCEGGIALVGDYFCVQPKHLTLDLLLAFSRHARKAQASAISLEFFGHPSVHAALKLAGFISKDGGSPVVWQQKSAPNPCPANMYMTSYERDMN